MEEAREEAEGVLEGVMKRNGEEKQVSRAAAMYQLGWLYRDQKAHRLV